MLRRLWCLLAGHDWLVIRVGPCNAWLMHLHAYIDTDADCRRCGSKWRDYAHHRAVCAAARGEI